MTEQEILDLVLLKILDLSYSISKRINLDMVQDEQIVAGQLVSLYRVVTDPNTNLTQPQRQQVLQGMLAITTEI